MNDYAISEQLPHLPINEALEALSHRYHVADTERRTQISTHVFRPAPEACRSRRETARAAREHLPRLPVAVHL